MSHRSCFVSKNNRFPSRKSFKLFCSEIIIWLSTQNSHTKTFFPFLLIVLDKKAFFVLLQKKRVIEDERTNGQPKQVKGEQ